jgi:hypothetical protein
VSAERPGDAVFADAITPAIRAVFGGFAGDDGLKLPLFFFPTDSFFLAFLRGELAEPWPPQRGGE